MPIFRCKQIYNIAYDFELLTIMYITNLVYVFFSVFKNDADEKGFAQYDELDEDNVEADEYSRSDKPEGSCPKWCMRCPTEKVGVDNNNQRNI